MRFCLRIGLIDVVDEKLKKRIIKRQIITPAEEWAVRYAAYRAREKIVTLSGESEGSVDWFSLGHASAALKCMGGMSLMSGGFRVRPS